MKTVEQIEKEYDSYIGKTNVIKSLDDFSSFIEVVIDDTKGFQRDYIKELKENERWQLSAKIRNFFFFVFEQEEEEFYNYDNDILKECIDYTFQMRLFFQRMKAIANNDNFMELVRLIDFSSDYYYAQTEYYDFEREQLELMYKGIQFYNSKYEDNRDSFFTFLNRIIYDYESSLKTPVYIKRGFKNG